jgi:hypothetical protein
MTLGEEFIITLQSSFLEEYLEWFLFLSPSDIFPSLDSLNVSFTQAEHPITLNPGGKCLLANDSYIYKTVLAAQHS